DRHARRAGWAAMCWISSEPARIGGRNGGTRSSKRGSREAAGRPPLLVVFHSRTADDRLSGTPTARACWPDAHHTGGIRLRVLLGSRGRGQLSDRRQEGGYIRPGRLFR